ncbi:MAG: T9SS type A sorting domain-containing protein [Flavobacteriales bacterium]|nr:T9SS type A sorting domain-containing protein [Flavobacteriales bacterium]
MRFLLLFPVCLLLCTRAIAQVPSYVPSDGLVGWWPFNGNANDESGNGNNGTVNGASLTSDRNGQPDAAYAFDGLSDFIATTAQGPAGTIGRTFSFWVRTESVSHQTPIDYFGGSGGSFQPILNNPCPGLGVDAGTGVVTRGDAGLIDAEWHHCALVFDPANGGTINSVKMYIDGVEQMGIACFALDQNALVNTTATLPVIFGKTTSDVRFLDGDLDDIGIWEQVLTEEEVLLLFTGGELPPSSHSCGATNVHNTNVQYGTMTDQEGTPYRTVQIGDQVWMAENLMTSHYTNGDEIPTIPAAGNLWNSTFTGASCWLNDDSATYACPYGKLYNWYAADDSRNVCPTGWHVPSITEFNTLLDHLGPTAGGQMKTQGVQYWTGGNLGGSNASGFSGLPTGTRWQDSYGEQGILAHFWCSTTDEVGLVNSDLVRLHFGQTNADVFTWDNRRGESIRCIQDVVSTGTGFGNDEQPALHVYPNPSHGAFMIELSGPDPATILVFDGVGRQVHREKVQGLLPKSVHTLDLTGLTPGVYWLAFERGGTRTGQSIVIH